MVYSLYPNSRTQVNKKRKNRTLEAFTLELDSGRAACSLRMSSLISSSLVLEALILLLSMTTFVMRFLLKREGGVGSGRNVSLKRG